MKDSSNEKNTDKINNDKFQTYQVTKRKKTIVWEQKLFNDQN